MCGTGAPLATHTQSSTDLLGTGLVLTVRGSLRDLKLNTKISMPGRSQTMSAGN